MEKKPKPKQEVKAEPLHCVFVSVASPGARAFVEQEVAEFGHMSSDGEEWTTATVWINPCYDIEEVRAYLESFGK